SLNMSAATTLTDDTERYNRSYTLLYSVPYGYATFSAFASHSDYLNTQPLQIYSVQLSGHTDQAGLRADYVVARDQRSINTLSVQLTRKQSRNYFADALLGISSPTLSVLSLSAARMQILDRGLVSLSASVDQGTPWLGADAPPPSGLSGLPDSHFTKFTVNADLYRYFQPAGLNLQWHSQLAAQYSADPLPGIEWFTVSDTYAVRGFSSSNVAADSGAFWRNDLTYRRPLLGGELRLLTGADIGQTLRGATHNPTYYAGGLTVGSDYQYQAVQAGIRVSRGRMWSAGRHTTEPLRVLARFSVSF
ncbi:MAG: ShlB/FhaC/HecB family hemolysin secretion/activation protein, partial [Plesiomonas shigelloides]